MARDTASRSRDYVLLQLERASPRVPARALSPLARLTLVFVAHAAVAGVLLVLTPPSPHATPPAASSTTPPRLVWLAPPPGEPVPSVRQQGGGGGGNRQPLAVTPAPEIRPAASAAPVTDEGPAQPDTRFLAHAADEPLAVGARPLGSLLVAPVLGPGVGRGVGVGGGLGDGSGTGTGGGEGPGVGEGSGGGSGGGVYRPGGGVTAPVLLSHVRPRYPDDAMQLRTQGSVALDVIVRRDGTATVVRVTRPIDNGPLDVEAARAVRQWRFRPGLRNGEPVDVLVTVVIDFVLY